jgi:hypothetical protein
MIQDSDQVQRAWARGWNASPCMSTDVVVHAKIRHIYKNCPTSWLHFQLERAVQQLCSTSQQYTHWQDSAKVQHSASSRLILVKHIFVRLTVARASQLDRRT